MLNPEAQPQTQAPVAPQANAPKGMESAADSKYNPDVIPQIEKHLESLPPEQQQFLKQYMTPELAIILGILLGPEAFDYFKRFADPTKQLSVQPRQQAPQQQGQAPAQPNAPQQQANAGQQPPQAQPPQSPIQPKATPPAKSIMGR